MSKPHRLRLPSPSLAVASIALVVATGGTATAATLMITSSKQIKTGIVTNADLKNGAGVGVADLTLSACRKLIMSGPAGPPALPGSSELREPPALRVRRPMQVPRARPEPPP